MEQYIEQRTLPNTRSAREEQKEPRVCYNITRKKYPKK